MDSRMAVDSFSEPTQETYLEAIAPKPASLDATGLPAGFMAELIAKHLYQGGVMTMQELSARLGLPGVALQQALDFMRTEAMIEIRGPSPGREGLRYAVSDRGKAVALEALEKSGYVGRAPVPFADYVRLVRRQTASKARVTRGALADAFSDAVMADALLDRLGPAIHSGRSMFLYGPPGTGKTFTAKRLSRLLDDPVLVPHAVLVGEFVIQVFDPELHQVVEGRDAVKGYQLDDGCDGRFHMCKRPFVVSGGELTLDMLEVRFDADRREYQAPLQMRANNGMLLIDDLGRQRVPPFDLLNRWIVPMEERRDFLHLAAGHHFAVPFDLVLVFSTNIAPAELADEAFLRRIGHKIKLDYLTPEAYEAVWKRNCEERGAACGRETIRYALEELHGRTGVPLLPCHPRDLIELAMDYCKYRGVEPVLTRHEIKWAWDSYFVELQGGKDTP